MPLDYTVDEDVLHTSDGTARTFAHADTSVNRLHEVAHLLNQAATLLSTTDDLQCSACGQDAYKSALRHHETQLPTSTMQQMPISQPSGWAAVEKALTDFDRQEIGAYKEDIDSLLTFTGLYSAVLTAFVVISYPQLQEDIAGETLYVLRTIANQNAAYATFGRQPINSTLIASASATPFQPSLIAIRINILWFTSLVISLATASFAILVKQWLRSYMAFATASPQGQLRIRRFRRAGLEAWKVFGIASMLPLFLQISLALFFVGLCIFTLDVHPAVGLTTLPLVCAWAFLFIAVTVSPAFTAGCPYTTPAFECVTHILRRRFNPFLFVIAMKHIPRAVVRIMQVVLDLLRASGVIYGEAAHNMRARFAKRAQRFSNYSPPRVVEEADVLKDTQHDLEILADADTLQADDRLLGTMITSALEQSDANWIQIIDFIMHIIGNRVPVDDDETNPERILESYHSLPPVVREVIAQMIRLHVIPKATREVEAELSFPENWQCSARWALCIFLDLNETDAPLLSLGLDMAVYDPWIENTFRTRADALHATAATYDRRELLWSIACIRIMAQKSADNESFRELACSKDVILHYRPEALSKPYGLRLQIMEEAGQVMMAHLDSLSLNALDPSCTNTFRHVFDFLGIADFTEAAIRLHRTSRGVCETVELSGSNLDRRLKNTCELLLCLIKFAGPSWRIQILRLCCVLDFTALCQILQSAYRDNVDEDLALSCTIHSMADSYLQDSQPDASPSRIEILKVSLLAVRQICGRNRATKVRRTWTLSAIDQWKRTLTSLADTYFRTSQIDGQPFVVLEASRKLAMKGWTEIGSVDFIEIEGSDGQPPLELRISLIPEYFYLMFWVAAGGTASRISASHPHLASIACMSRTERDRIYDNGRQDTWAYCREHVPEAVCWAGDYNAVEPADVDITRSEFKVYSILR